MNLCVDVPTAEEILGYKRVVSAAEAAYAWRLPLSLQSIQEIQTIPYSETVLCACAGENMTGAGNWYLVYHNGLSLWQQYRHDPLMKTQGVNMGPDPPPTCKESASSGYRLLNLRGSFPDHTWQDQEHLIDQRRYVFRAPASVISEAVLSIFYTHKKMELRTWYHWGASETQPYYRVCVGLTKTGYLQVNQLYVDWYSSEHQVCLEHIKVRVQNRRPHPQPA